MTPLCEFRLLKVAFSCHEVLRRDTSRLLKKISEARRAINRRAEAYFAVRWSEAIERNEAYESFSAAS